MVEQLIDVDAAKNAAAPLPAVVQLLRNDGDDPADPAEALRPRFFRIHQHTLSVDVPPVVSSRRVHHAASPGPAAHGVEGIRQTTDGLGEIRIRLHGALVVHDGILDPALIFDGVGEVGERDVKVSVTLDGLLVHLDGRGELADVLEQTAQIGVEVRMSSVQVQAVVVIRQRESNSAAGKHTGNDGNRGVGGGEFRPHRYRLRLLDAGQQNPHIVGRRRAWLQRQRQIVQGENVMHAGGGFRSAGGGAPSRHAILIDLGEREERVASRGNGRSSGLALRDVSQPRELTVRRKDPAGRLQRLVGQEQDGFTVGAAADPVMAVGQALVVKNTEDLLDQPGDAVRPPPGSDHNRIFKGLGGSGVVPERIEHVPLGVDQRHQSPIIAVGNAITARGERATRGHSAGEVSVDHDVGGVDGFIRIRPGLRCPASGLDHVRVVRYFQRPLDKTDDFDRLAPTLIATEETHQMLDRLEVTRPELHRPKPELLGLLTTIERREGGGRVGDGFDITVVSSVKASLPRSWPEQEEKYTYLGLHANTRAYHSKA